MGLIDHNASRLPANAKRTGCSQSMPNDNAASSHLHLSNPSTDDKQTLKPGIAELESCIAMCKQSMVQVVNVQRGGGSATVLGKVRA